MSDKSLGYMVIGDSQFLWKNSSWAGIRARTGTEGLGSYLMGIQGQIVVCVSFGLVCLTSQQKKTTALSAESVLCVRSTTDIVLCISLHVCL